VGLRVGWTRRLEEKFFASARNRTPVVQSVVRHYTDRATSSSEIIRDVSLAPCRPAKSQYCVCLALKKLSS
jgi:hypothetical protein